MGDKRVSNLAMWNASMHIGTVLGVYYVLKFCLFPLGMKSGLLGMVFIVLTLLGPVLAYRLTRGFRRMSMPDASFASLGQAWGFVFQLFLFASLLVSVAHYVYFAFIDHGMLLAAYNTTLAQMAELAKESGAEGVAMQTQLDAMKATVDMVAAMTPIQITMQLLVNNLFWGCLLGLPIGALNMREDKKPINRDNQ